MSLSALTGTLFCMIPRHSRCIVYSKSDNRSNNSSNSGNNDERTNSNNHNI